MFRTRAPALCPSMFSLCFIHSFVGYSCVGMPLEYFRGELCVCVRKRRCETARIVQIKLRRHEMRSKLTTVWLQIYFARVFFLLFLHDVNIEYRIILLYVDLQTSSDFHTSPSRDCSSGAIRRSDWAKMCQHTAHGKEMKVEFFFFQLVFIGSTALRIRSSL